MENETSDAKVPIVERHKEIDLKLPWDAGCYIRQFPAVSDYLQQSF